MPVLNWLRKWLFIFGIEPENWFERWREKPLCVIADPSGNCFWAGDLLESFCSIKDGCRERYKDA